MSSVRGWAGVLVWEILHYGACVFERCVFISIFLTGEYPTDLTHMNGPAADRFGCCLLMHCREGSVQLYLRYEEKRKACVSIRGVNPRLFKCMFLIKVLICLVVLKLFSSLASGGKNTQNISTLFIVLDKYVLKGVLNMAASRSH